MENRIDGFLQIDNLEQLKKNIDIDTIRHPRFPIQYKQEKLRLLIRYANVSKTPSSKR